VAGRTNEDEERTQGIVLSPEILARYQELSPALPELVLYQIQQDRERDEAERIREYEYATRSQYLAWAALIVFVAPATYLAMHGNNTGAGLFLGAALANTVGGFLRARLNERATKRQEENHRIPPADQQPAASRRIRVDQD
jgi:hypothetical protein